MHLLTLNECYDVTSQYWKKGLAKLSNKLILSQILAWFEGAGKYIIVLKGVHFKGLLFRVMVFWPPMALKNEP